MKRLFLIVVSLCITLLMQAQVTKTVNTTAGGLSAALSPTELTTVTNLTLTGTIDARDFKTMRDNMPVLAMLDLESTSISAYTGTEGTFSGTNAFTANTVPDFAFSTQYTHIAKTSLISIILPSSSTSIGSCDFYGCTGLASVSIPSSVTNIGEAAFYYCKGLISFNLPSSLSDIGMYAFAGCTGLTSISIPASVISIRAAAFLGCNGLTSVTISSPISSIENRTFQDCTSLTSFNIPSSVTNIGSSAFANCSGLTSLTIPSSVTSIENATFRGCKGLTTFSLPSTITFIGGGAFSGCKGLTSLTIPSAITTIGDETFKDCSGLTSVILPSSLNSIGFEAFYNCSSLTSLVLPSSLILIGWEAFYNCSGLTSVNIPNSVKYIAEYAFKNCSSLKTIYLDVTTPIDLNSTTGVFYNVNKTTCILYIPYGTLASYTAPVAYPWNTFKTIVELPGFLLSSSDISFASASSTDSVTIASNVTWTATSDQSWLTLNPISFTGNNTLSLTVQANSSVATRTAIISITSPGVITRKIIVNQVGVSKILNVTAGGLFSALTADERSTITKLILTGTIDARDFKTMRDDMPVLAELDLSGASIAAYLGSEGTNVNSNIYLVNAVPHYAFYNSITNIPNTSLKSVILPTSSTSIGDYTFGRCSGLLTVTIPSSVTSIGRLAFWNCTGLTSVVLPSSLISFGGSTFYGCTGLTSITIPSSVISIESSVFYQCSGLTSVTIPSSVTSIGAFAFNECKGLISVTIPSSVTSIGASAFSGCTGLTSMAIPISVTSIGKNAFNSCRGLTSINIPSSVKSIEASTFQECNGLKSINIPSSVTSIGDYAFASCLSLTTLVLPSSVSTIGAGAFKSLNSLKSINIPSSVTSIGNHALEGCISLTTLAIPSSVTTIGAGAFISLGNLKSIYAYGVTPVDLSSSPEVFLYDNFTTCILYVPYGSSTLYRAANQWKDFLNIVEMPVAGSITANQTICSGITPAPLTSTVAGAGQGTISYRWEYSYDGISWLSTGTSAETYAPDALTQTTIFRRITISTVNGTSWESTPTEPVTISVTLNNTITLSSAVGTDAQMLCDNSAITNITYTTTGATGATFSGLPEGVTGAWNSNMVTISGIPSLTGTFNYIVSLTGGCGVITKTGSISIGAFTPSVTINASQNNVYSGTPVTFTAIPVGGGTSPTYKWFLNNVVAATGPGGTYVPKNGDVIFAQMTSSLACSAGSIATSNTITMVVNPVPVVSGVSISANQNNVCPGTPVTLTANPVNGGNNPTFIWYLNNVARATGASGTYVPQNGDAVYVVMTSNLPNVTGSPATSNVVTMVVGAPATQPAYFTEGLANVTPGQSNVRYTVPYVANVTYSWNYTGDGATISGTSNSVLISFSATATSGTLSVSASNSCGTSNPRSGNITVGTTLKAGIISEAMDQGTIEVPSAKNKLKVYPNPASGPVTFEFQINEDAKVTLDLLSMTGQLIARIFDTDAQAGITHAVIYSEQLSAGVYLYTLRWKDQTIIGKFIITK